MSIIPPIRVTPDEERQLLEELLENRNPPATGGIPGPFAIEDRADRYIIHGLSKPYRQGETFTLELSKQLLDGGKPHTQDQWRDTPALRTIGGMVWELPTGPEYNSLILDLYAHKDVSTVQQRVEAVRTLLKKDFDSHWMMTSTRISYRAGQQASGMLGRRGKTPTPVLDAITHHYKRSNEPKLDAAIVGQNGWIAAGMEEQLYAVMGSRDINTFGSATEWLTTKKPYLWRVGSTPAQDDPRALVLGVVGSSRFGVGADSGGSRPARGVAVRENFP